MDRATCSLMSLEIRGGYISKQAVTETRAESSRGCEGADERDAKCMGCMGGIWEGLPEEAVSKMRTNG